MSFLQPLLLMGLPLVLIPLVIHLIHILRRRQVRWAAMMFLHKAQRMNKGFSKLRQYLILAFRMLAVSALIFMIGRPLAGGLLGLTGGAPDSVVILLDRSASMEEQLLATGTSKRTAALRNLGAALKEAYGQRTVLTLIDSATLTPVTLSHPDAFPNLPQAGSTSAAADIPSLLQAGLDFVTTNQTGRTDLWLVSDLRATDWNAQGGRWPGLRESFAALAGVRFQVLVYPETEQSDFGITIDQVSRRQSGQGQAELLLDLRIRRRAPASDPVTLPVRVVVNGISTTLNVDFRGSEVLRQAQAIPISQSVERGWGRVELPADGSPADNAFHFVFDRPPPLESVIVSDARDEVILPVQAALRAQADPSRTYQCTVLSTARATEIQWEETSLIVWQAPLPEADTPLAQQLAAHLAGGRAVLFLPPEEPGGHAFDGITWSSWQRAEPGESIPADWWRSDSGLLAATQAGSALPVGEVEVQRWCPPQGECVPLARLGDAASNAPLLVQSLREDGRGAYFLSTLPGVGVSNLGRSGVVLFALLHRSLNQGAAALGNALQRTAAADSLSGDPADWTPLDVDPESVLTMDRALRAGVLEQQPTEGSSVSRLVALNRPPGEDAPQTLARSTLDELMAGLDWRLLERSLENEKSLTSEVWRTFLVIMAAAIVFEALLCMPGRPEKTRAASAGALKPGSPA